MTKIPNIKDKIEDFKFEDNDKLNRKIIADNFNSIFKNTEGSLVLAIDASWGDGKSAFLHMWKNQLKDLNRNVIYINAWEEDFFKLPFLSLFEAFREKFDREKTKITEIGKNISKTFLKNKTGIDIDEILKSDESPYEELKKQKEELKELIGEKVQELQGEFPLIIMVDELDRCNPLYSIEFLETIKHFFEIEKVIFVLGLDIRELEHSIRKVYGYNINTDKYLKKLIDIKYELPEPNYENFIELLDEKHNKILSKLRNYDSISQILINHCKNLRDLEKFFLRFHMFLKYNKIEPYHEFQEVIIFMISQLDNKLFYKIKTQTLSLDEIENIFDFLKIEYVSYSTFLTDVYGIAKYGCNIQRKDEKNEKFNETIKNLIETDEMNIGHDVLDIREIKEIISKIDFLRRVS